MQARARLLTLSALATAIVISCTPERSAPGPLPPAPPGAPTAAGHAIRYDEEGLALFRERGVTGSFVLLDVATRAKTVVGREDAEARHVPFSTFKIPNTLIGLETGVIGDEHFSLTWDGREREFADWNRDQDLASAMQRSTVWFYQEVARRIGAERMRAWVSKLDYGNREVSGPIDAFWLDDGSLRITAHEEVEHIRRLLAGELPVRDESRRIVERIVPSERVGDAVVHGKTGLGFESGRAMGWIVGWVDRGEARSIFATHVEAPKTDIARLMPLRRELTHALLARYGVL